MASGYRYEGRLWFVSRSASGYVTCGFPTDQEADRCAAGIDILVSRQKPVPPEKLAAYCQAPELPGGYRILQPLKGAANFLVIEDEFKALWPDPYNSIFDATEAAGQACGPGMRG